MNDEQWDDRLRRALSAQSDGGIDVRSAVLRRVRNGRRWKVGITIGCLVMVFAGAVAWFSNSGHRSPTTLQPNAPVAKQETAADSLADLFPPPVEQLDVIGRHQDAFAKVFDNWNEEQP